MLLSDAKNRSCPAASKLSIPIQAAIPLLPPSPLMPFNHEYEPFVNIYSFKVNKIWFVLVEFVGFYWFLSVLF